jgi:hypothetical protein
LLHDGAWLAMDVFTKIFAVTAYLPAILLAGFLAETTTQLRFVFPFFCIHLGFIGATTLLLHTGFFETQFKEFEGSGFLLSPSLV